MNRLERAIAEHRAAIRSIDRAALANVLNTYEEIMARLNPQIEVLVQTLRTKGELTPSELFRLDRYQELQRQIAEEMRTLATATGDITAQAQARAIQEAVTSAEQMAVSAARGTSATATVATSWVNVPTKAVEDFIGASRSGPLAELLASFEDVTGRAMVDQITNALATGTNPRAVADAIVKSTEIGRNRALTIARTEMMRASRGATLAQYEENADILQGWIWSCAKSDRTCSACLAMDGTKHPQGEAMDSHVNCRCSPIPWLKDIPMRKVETGEEWLAKQTPEQQDAILGKAGGAAYRAGEVQLSHFVRVTDSADWGRSVTDGGIGFARMNAARTSQLSSVPTLKDAERIVERANDGGVFKRKLDDGEFEELVPREVREDYAAKTNNDDFEVRRLEIDNLIGEAENYDPERVMSFVNEQIDPSIGPSILRYDGENYIMDGHHRILSRAVRGEKTAVVRVYDMGAKRVENNDWLFPNKKRRVA